MSNLVARDGKFKSVGSCSIDKAEHYDWNKDFGGKGKLEWVGKTELRIDESYQRQQSKAKALRISRDFIWAAFGVIIVSKRPNGTYFVMDGGHRTLCVHHRTDIDKVPCYVISGLSKEDEAKAYVLMNTHRKSPSGIEVYAAQVVAKDETVIAIDRILGRFGIVIDNNKANPKACRSPRRLQAIYNSRGPDELQRVLAFITRVWSGDPMALTADVLMGCAEFCKDLKEIAMKIDDAEAIDKFKSISIAYLAQQATAWQQVTKGKAQSFRLAMRSHWNKGRRTRQILGVAKRAEVSGSVSLTEVAAK